MADDAAHPLTIVKVTHEDSVPANDSDFLRECIDIGLAGYREAVRSRSRSGRDYSIARCDNRINNAGWRYEDGARGSTDVGMADADTDGEANVAANGNEHDDPVLLPADAVAEQDALRSTEPDADTHAGAAAAPAADAGAVPSTGQRWAIGSHLLHSVKPNTNEGR